MELTKELLKEHGACPDAIKFCDRNQLFGFPLDRLDEIDGDYSGYVEWLRNELKSIRTYDDHGNVIHHKDSDDIEYWQTFDDHGNMIHHKDSDGYEYWQTFDDHGNMIHSKDSYGCEYWREYDDHGNMIHYKSSNGFEYWQEFDDRGNVVHYKDTIGREVRHEVEYYDNGQLKRYDRLHIPKF